MKCPGYPGWPCGRDYIGPAWDLECLTHGSKEQVDARNSMCGKTKLDFEPEIRHSLPIATPKDLALALQGELL